jgi:dynein intermediate chain 1
MAVYALKWNPFHPRIFLSCSADWTVKVWDRDLNTPVMSFDLGNGEGDLTLTPFILSFDLENSRGGLRIGREG